MVSVKRRLIAAVAVAASLALSACAPGNGVVAQGAGVSVTTADVSHFSDGLDGLAVVRLELEELLQGFDREFVALALEGLQALVLQVGHGHGKRLQGRQKRRMILIACPTAVYAP